MAISDERLSAFIEGQLPPDERAALEAAIAEDPALAQRVRTMRALRARIARWRRPLERRKAPAIRLVATGRTETGHAAQLIDLGAARAERLRRKRAPWIRTWSRRAMLGGAVMLGLFVCAEFLLNPIAAPLITTADGMMIAHGDLAKALSDRLSSAPQQANTAVRVGPSFVSTHQLYCRNFAINNGHALRGVACREPWGWRVCFAADQTLAASPGRLATVAAMAGEKPLSPQAEAAARARGWRV